MGNVNDKLVTSNKEFKFVYLTLFHCGNKSLTRF